MKQRMIRAKAILAVVLSVAMTLGSMSPAYAADGISSDTISYEMIREDIVSNDAMSLNLGNLDTSRAADMSYMFSTHRELLQYNA